uniref:Large ribosomal subunit protein eL24 n=1 Tax=Nothobranchius furzeri TaxID=105023 RepID=A0A8C6VW73_NOTFU
FRVELCSFSGYKIYPGHGRRYARIDGKVFQFLNAKCESAFLSKRNPRQINWTVLYRRKHKKGQSEEVTKKRTRRAVKFTRAITGASLAEIMAKRNQKPEVRKAQREQAIREAVLTIRTVMPLHYFSYSFSFGAGKGRDNFL